MEDFTINVSIL